jgi:uncharacterized RDD family membrane protein YckC
MSGVAPSLDGDMTDQSMPEDGERFIGVVTRAISWILDAVLINVAAIMTGLGVELIASIFPISKDVGSVLKPVAAVVYGVWCAAYFIVFWAATGQTPGARVMQIRLVTATRQRVKPARAIVRWVGMTLAMLPLFAGYLPILFGRRGFPDWLARTLVIDAPGLSVAAARQATMRAARDGSRQPAAAISSDSAPPVTSRGDGSASPVSMREPSSSQQRR